MTAGKFNDVASDSAAQATQGSSSKESPDRAATPEGGPQNAVVLKFARRWRANAAAKSGESGQTEKTEKYQTVSAENHPLRRRASEEKIKEIKTGTQRRFSSLMQQVNNNPQDAAPDRGTSLRSPNCTSPDMNRVSSPTSPSWKLPPVGARSHSSISRYSPCRSSSRTSNREINLGDGLSFAIVGTSPVPYAATSDDSLPPRSATPLGLDAVLRSPLLILSPHAPPFPKGSSQLIHLHRINFSRVASPI